LISGTYKLIDGALAQKLKFETISNNLANINTNAFKKDIVSFHEVLGMKNRSSIDFTPGPKRYTGNRLDVALEGNGFFKIQTPRGERYTRDGSFSLNADRQLVTRNGDIVLGNHGSIKIQDGSISIETDGTVIIDGGVIDKLIMADFRDPQLLIKEGNSCYRYGGEEGDIVPPEETTVQNGYLETSNVNPTEEMIKMVEVLRVFESAQKAIQCMDEITEKMVNDTGLVQ
jgi:flagellar basal-body rod protein FlgF